MTKAVLFAGQGAQHPGMGKSLFDNLIAVRVIYDEAERLRPGIKDLCFDSDQAELNKTINTQPCVFVTDLAAYVALRSEGFAADMGAGFSLGEYAALTAAGVFSFDDALRLVVKRAEWMQEAAEKYGGGMVAILGKAPGEVDDIVKRVKSNGVLTAVNYNCPGQTVVAGDEAEIEALLAYSKENKVKASRLPVNGAFHSARMSEPAAKIYDHIENMELSSPSFPVYANVNAQPYGKDGIKRVLADQTASPVLFEQTLRNMIDAGCGAFYEVGPGKTLAGFVKRIDKSLSIYSVNDYDSFVAARASL